jgi:hypothetical protein
VRRLVVRQAQVRFSARHPTEGFPTEITNDEEKKRNLGEWRRMNVLNECTVCTVKFIKYKKSGIMPPNLKKSLDEEYLKIVDVA